MKFGPEFTDSIELRFAHLARAKNADGLPIVSLGLGEPDFPTPPAIVDAAAAALRAGWTKYSNPFGLPDLRERIAGKLITENGIPATPAQIIVAPGAKMALSLALGALLEPDDEIVVITPCYTSYIPQAKIAEPTAVVRRVDLRRQDFGLDVGALAAALTPRTRVVVLNSPNNPTGHMLSANERDELAVVLADKNLWLVSDEIYEKLTFTDTAHLSPAAHPKLAARTITINGFSKAYAMTGWRIGYAHVPDGTVMDRMSKLQQHLNTNTAPFIQKAALAALDMSGDHLDAYNRRLAVNAAALAARIAAMPEIRLVAPAGGLFAFVDVSAAGMDSDGFATALLEEESVAVTPGVVFAPEWDGYVRVSLAIDPDSFAQGIGRLEAFARRRIRRRD